MLAKNALAFTFILLINCIVANRELRPTRSVFPIFVVLLRYTRRRSERAGTHVNADVYL